MSGKVTAVGVSIIAGCCVWDSFGPRLYIVQGTHKSGARTGNLFYALINPAIYPWMIEGQIPADTFIEKIERIE